MRDAPSHTGVRRRVAAFSTAVAVGAGIVAGGAASPAAAAVPAPDLRYSMDDVTGTTVPDSSGNGLDGTISGSTALVDSDESTALDLTGGHVVLPRDILDGATDLTVATRVRWDGGASWQWLFGLGSDNSRYLFTSPSSGDGKLRTAITRAGGGSNEQTVTGSGPLKTGEWIDLTVTLDTAGDRLVTYIDGAAVSSVATDVTAGELLTDAATGGGFIGKSFYPDPAFDGAIDDFQVFRSALTAEQVLELSGAEAPTLESITETSFEVRTRVNEAPVLPEVVRGAYSDGVERDVPITWDEVPADSYAQSGVFTVAGRAADVDVTAEVTVNRGEVRIDMAENTGDVYGGASGVLYGLYGDGMPTSNLVEGMDVRTVATKAQDGGQHPGSDALEILPTLTATGGDVYLRITDYYRGFPYQWPGDTPEEKLADYRAVLDEQLAMIETIPAEQREHLVIEPFNEPEGNMFGTGEWSLDGTSWLEDPTDYFAAWDSTYERIKEVFPDMRIAGPGTSILYSQLQGYLDHVIEADTVPDIITWHELSDPASIRTSVDRYRGWEATAFEGTSFEGTELPININEYAFNYHTSVPGQMIQWISAIEETKIDAMIAFWNINGNLADSAVQQNRANGQWWLYNSYAQMSGHTVELTAPSPGESYTLQGVSSLDEEKEISRTIIGGADGAAPVDLVNIPSDVFGDTARVQVREIPWTGQLGDSEQPIVLSDRVVDVASGALTVDFGSDGLPALTESSAYEILISPGDGAEATAATPAWNASFEAEDAAYTGSGYTRNGPEGSPNDVSKFYTSGGYNVGGLRTGSNGELAFTVDVPETGAYDLSVFANSLNTYEAIEENGPTNVFMTVDGGAEQELFLPLAYKWVVWDHADTTVQLEAGRHTITLAATSLDGSRTTQGDALIDRITLERSAPDDAVTDYEAEYADHTGTPTATGVDLAADQSATFWVYGAADAEATLEVLGSGTGTVAVNDEAVLDLDAATEVAVHLEGGVNKIVVSGEAEIDLLRVAASQEKLAVTEYQAEDAELSGTAAPVDLGLAEGGLAVDGIGGDPGNDNAATFTVEAASAGKHAVVVRFSNPEQVPATHYNPNPMARHADISVNGGAAERVLFVPTFHENNFWERTLVFDLEEGENTIRFSAEEQPNFDGVTYAQENFPGIPLRADTAPILDRISVSALAAAIDDSVVVPPTEPEPETPGTPGGGGDPEAPSDGDNGSGDGNGSGGADADGTDDDLAATGSSPLGAILTALALLLVGALAVLRRRHRTANR
ncbi:LamG-like jellyroll fold domain-containing protein [Labedella endophytica]|uniref:Cellulosome enzyme n=1 Tax=Labedella endophytica TaxID=1523160 RepID=A0A3S0VD06_9MICO|nr:LamG-like jellyroll fold domain-containing protein [Labedella endophytica]RUR03107.1 cellulosome enzyme [Labedella endophytica]